MERAKVNNVVDLLAKFLQMVHLSAIAQISHYKENVIIVCGHNKNVLILQVFVPEIYAANKSFSQIVINLLADVQIVSQLIIVDIIQTYSSAKIQHSNVVDKIVVLIKELIRLEARFADVLQI